MASNVYVSTVARLVVPHKVPTTDLAALTYLLHPCMWPVSCWASLCQEHMSRCAPDWLCPCALIHVKVGKGSRAQKRNIVPVHDTQTDRHTDKISTFITRKGLASLAPINYTIPENTTAPRISNAYNACSYRKSTHCVWQVNNGSSSDQIVSNTFVSIEAGFPESSPSILLIVRMYV